MNSLVETIEIIKHLEDTSFMIKSLEFVYQSNVFPPETWDKTVFQKKFDIQIPSELALFWSIASEVRLYTEKNYSQWGTILWCPSHCLNNQANYMKLRAEDFLEGDLIIGEYLGDQDLILIRCNPKVSDFSKILIVQSMERRRTWQVVSNTIADFLIETLNNPYAKFWENNNARK